MNDEKTIRDLQTTCEAGDLRRLWSQETIRALARLSETNLRAALAAIRFHLGRDCSPRLFARDVREERKRYLDRLQRIEVKKISATSKTKLERSARLWARAGGLHRGRKGFAAFTPEQRAEILPMGPAARRRIAAERRAAVAPLLANDPPPPAGASVGLPPFWWTDKPECPPASPGEAAPDDGAAPTVTIGRPRARRQEGFSK